MNLRERHRCIRVKIPGFLHLPFAAAEIQDVPEQETYPGGHLSVIDNPLHLVEDPVELAVVGPRLVVQSWSHRFQEDRQGLEAFL